MPPHCQTWSAEKLDAAKMAIRFGSAAEQRKNIYATLSKSIHLAPCTVSPLPALSFKTLRRLCDSRGSRASFHT